MSASQERLPTLDSVAPRFLVRDMEQALAFYGQLGFATTSHNEGFAIVERDGISLHFLRESIDAPADMRAYSYDFRQRILRAVDQGKPRAEMIKTFAVSRSTIKRYLKLRRETGDIKPKVIAGRPSKKGAALHTGLLPQLDVHPDVILTEQQALLSITAHDALGWFTHCGYLSETYTSAPAES